MFCYTEFYKRFAEGEQYIYLDPIAQEIRQEDKQYYWEERKVYNHIAPIIETVKNKLSDTIDHQLLDIKIYGVHGLVSQLEPYQRDYNNLMNKKAEFINKILYTSLITEDGSVDVDSLSEEGLRPGKILIYRQGAQIPKLVEYSNSKEILKALHDEETNILKRFNIIKQEFIKIIESEKH